MEACVQRRLLRGGWRSRRGGLRRRRLRCRGLVLHVQHPHHGGLVNDVAICPLGECEQHAQQLDALLAVQLSVADLREKLEHLLPHLRRQLRACRRHVPHCDAPGPLPELLEGVSSIVAAALLERLWRRHACQEARWRLLGLGRQRQHGGVLRCLSKATWKWKWKFGRRASYSIILRLIVHGETLILGPGRRGGRGAARPRARRIFLQQGRLDVH
mmetsp:Transcript_5814/g.15605  ORF Transcript_5814/g.15605 Transcript_5814/m.15605 type:complete len:215 (+) Transcript_5814:898-1542(+)